MYRLQWASRFTLFSRAGLVAIALALLLPGCGGGGSDGIAPVSEALTAPGRQAMHVQPQVPDANALMDWAEIQYAGYFPSHQINRSFDIFLFRFYPETGIYLAVAGQDVYVLPAGGQPLRVGVLADFACQVYPASCVSASSLRGETLYRTALGSAGNACRDCHGPTPGVGGVTDILKAAGTQASHGEASVIRAAIDNNEGGVMGQFSAVTDAQLDDIAAYVNASFWGKPLE